MIEIYKESAGIRALYTTVREFAATHPRDTVMDGGTVASIMT